MLVLSRRIGETLLIGDDIQVTILKSRRGQVKVGIEAPKEMTISREELVDEQHFSSCDCLPTIPHFAGQS